MNIASSRTIFNIENQEVLKKNLQYMLGTFVCGCICGAVCKGPILATGITFTIFHVASSALKELSNTLGKKFQWSKSTCTIASAFSTTLAKLALGVALVAIGTMSSTHFGVFAGINVACGLLIAGVGIYQKFSAVSEANAS